MAAGDFGLETLLELDGFIAEVGGGCWVKFEVKKVPSTKAVPHGLRYSLTLHESSGERVLGLDNANTVKVGTGPGSRRSVARDHMHAKKVVRAYNYQDAGALLETFWAQVDAYLEKKE